MTQKNKIPAHLLRKPCMGGCGTEVLVSLGAECRKCRRARLHKGARLLFKLRRETNMKRKEAAAAKRRKK